MGTPAIDAAIAAAQAQTDSDPTMPADDVQQAFYGGTDTGSTGFSTSDATPQPLPTGTTGMEWAPRGWANPQAPQDATSQSGSVSVATKGVTDRGLKRAHGVFDQAADRADAELKPFQAELAGERTTSEKHFADASAANQAAAEQEKIHNDKLAAIETHKANLQAAWAARDEEIQGESKAVGAHIIDQYKQQLAGVAALARSTGNPIDDLTRTQALGLAGAQFVQGFMAAAGKTINVTGQIDHWVDTSMKAHQQQIENARTAAGDTLNLYQIARQSSADDSEARLKYRGMVVEGLQSQIMGEAARYNASTAVSRAQLANATLQIDKDKVTRELGRAGEQQYYQIHGEENKRAHDELQAAMEMQRLAVEASKIKAAKTPPPDQYIFGPQQMGPDGKMHRYAVGKIVKGSDDNNKRRETADSAVAGYEELTPQLRRYADAIIRLKNKGLIAKGGLGSYAGKLDDPDYQEADALRKQIAVSVTKVDNGTRSSDQEMQNHLDQIPISPYTAGNDKVFQNFLDAQREKMNATIAGATDHSVDPSTGRSGLTEDEKRYELHVDDADQPSKAVSDAVRDPGNSAQMSPNAKLAAEATASKERPATGGYMEGQADKYDTEFKIHDPHTTKRMSQAWVDAKGGGHDEYESEQPGWAVATDHLAAHALHGDKEALQSIRGIADGTIDAPLPSQRRYAEEILKGIESDPKGLAESLSGRVEGKDTRVEEGSKEVQRAYNGGFDDEETNRRAWAQKQEALAKGAE